MSDHDHLETDSSYQLDTSTVLNSEKEPASELDPIENESCPLSNVNSEDVFVLNENGKSIKQSIVGENEETQPESSSMNDDALNETYLNYGVEMNETEDVEPNTIDSLNDSPPNTNSINMPKVTKQDQKSEKISQFPLGRIKDIMKSDPDIKIVSGECVFLVAKATEMFLQVLGKEIHTVTLRNKKKTLQKKDLDAAISENPALEFLEGALD